MNKVLKNSWALFLGMGFIMMAYGFQGSLLGVRAVQEEFSLTACLLYTSPSPRDVEESRMPSSA